MVHKKIDVNSPEYKEYEAARNEVRVAGQEQYKLLHRLRPKAERNEDERAVWAIFNQKYREIHKRFHAARIALTRSLMEPLKAPNMERLASYLNYEAPLPSVKYAKEENLMPAAFSEIARAAAMTPEEREALIKANEAEGNKPIAEGLGVSVFDNDLYNGSKS